MRLRMMDMIACPACSSPLDLEAYSRRGDEVIRGLLSCPSCGRDFRIEDGIPRLMPTGLSGVEQQVYGSIESYYDAYRPVMEEIYHNPRIAYMRKVEDACIRLTKPRGLVLDVGCGTGRQSLLLAELGCHVVATDISLGMLLEARRRAEKRGLRGQVEFIQASADALPFRPGVFSRAYSLFGAFNHAPRLLHGLRRLRRSLKKGGLFLLSVLNRYQLTWWIEAMLKRRKKQLMRALLGKPYYFTMKLGRKRRKLWTRLLSAPELKRYLKQVGFRNIRIGCILLFLKPKFSYEPSLELRGLEASLASLEERLRWLPPFSWLGAYIIALAERA